MLRPRVRLERPSAWRERDYLDAAHRSRELHRGLVAPARNPLEYRDYLRRARRNGQESFFVLVAATGALAGVINVNDIVRHPQPSGRLGYYAFVPHAANGLMREGLALVIAYAFRDLGLHRLEADIQPANRRSLALVESLGFELEDTAHAYLKIGGRWRDHQRWALAKDDWRAAGRLAPSALLAGVLER